MNLFSSRLTITTTEVLGNLFKTYHALSLKSSTMFCVAGNVRHFYDARSKLATIYALSSSINNLKGSALAIVRASGPSVPEMIERLTGMRALLPEETAVKLQNPGKTISPRKATLAKIYKPNSNELIDIGMLLWFRAPHSYTGEHICEFHVHGSQAIISSLLKAIGEIEGCRPAEPGEFTRRAVDNKKMNLPMAEGLVSLVSSKTDRQRKLALSALTGTTNRLYHDWLDQLVSILAHLEASIDFGEDELLGEHKVVNECIAKINMLHNEIIAHIVRTSRVNDIIKHGPRIAIVGRPNAGKSTFMNRLCQKDLSIVSSISGTTRDVIEHTFELAGNAVLICDTAGLKFGHSNIIDTADPIEEEGIQRAIAKAQKADILLLVVDAAMLQSQDKSLNILLDDLKRMSTWFGSTPQQARILRIIFNKIDTLSIQELGDLNSYIDKLNERIKQDQLSKESWQQVEIDTLSCKAGNNFAEFEAKIDKQITSMCEFDEGNENDLPIFINERHTSHLKDTHRHLEKASIMTLNQVDEMAQHVREAIASIERIVGTVTNDQVLDVIFRDFCIGK